MLIDLDIVERNIRRCQEQSDRLGVTVRPRIRMHELPLLAQTHLAAGAIGVTVLKIGKAKVMVDAEIEDILVTAKQWKRRIPRTDDSPVRRSRR